MNWIYLSPHLDDVALSCGGLAWQQVQAGDTVSIWTICAGDPPAGPLSVFAESLHDRWGTGREAVRQRRQEDIASCTELGATYRHFNIPDCIYRAAPDTVQYLYTSEESLWGAIHPQENNLVQELGQEIARLLPPGAQVICPLGLGKHVDHTLTRAAAEKIGLLLWYYADYPYVLKSAHELDTLERAGWQIAQFPIKPAALNAWQRSIARHVSQISTFWPHLPAMRADLADYCHLSGGVRLWQAPQDKPGDGSIETLPFSP